MRYTIIIGLLATMAGMQAFAQNSKQKKEHKPNLVKQQEVNPGVQIHKTISLDEWGTATGFSPETMYKIDDNGSQPQITITVTFFKERHVDNDFFQLVCTVTRAITFSATPPTATKEQIDTLITQTYKNGKPVGKGDRKNDFPPEPVQHLIVMPMSIESFRTKYKDLLPPPLQDWRITSTTQPHYYVEYNKKGQIVLMKSSHITRETDFQGRHIKIGYLDKIVTTYNFEDHSVQTKETVESVKGSELNQKGIDLTWTVGGNKLQIHFSGEHQGADDPANPPITTTPEILNDLTLDYAGGPSTGQGLYQDLYWQYDSRPVWTATINYAPTYTSRTNSVTERQFTHTTEQQDRNTTELGRYGQILEVQAGETWHKVHTWHIGFMYLQDGFKQNGAAGGGIDWTTGLSSRNIAKNGLRLEHYGLSAGYSYTGFSSMRTMNGIFDFSLFYLSNTHTGEGLRWDQFGVKVAFGLSIHKNYRWDFHLMPSFLYNISSINKGNVLKSNLYNAGITAGITYRFNRKKRFQ